MNVRIQIQVIPLNVRSIKSLRIIVEDVYDLQKTVKDFINEFPTGCHCPKANCQFHGDIYIRCQMSCYFSLFNVLLTMKLPESKNHFLGLKEDLKKDEYFLVESLNRKLYLITLLPLSVVREIG